MLFTPLGVNTFGANQFSWGTARPVAGTTPGGGTGTIIAPVTTNAYSNYSQVGSALSFDTYGILINVNSNTGTNSHRASAIKIGIDLAGGTTFTDTITGLIVSDAAQYYIAGGVFFYFPLFIPAGATVGAAARGSNTANTFNVNATYLQKPLNPSVIRNGAYTETLGVTLGAGTVTGTSITPGTTNEGAWTLIGQTTQRLWWWQLAVQVADASKSNSVLFVDLAVGDTNVLNDPKDIIIENFLLGSTTADALTTPPLTAGVEHNVPAGKYIWVRAQNSTANDSLYSAAVYGCGG
jgi:hypothetical protein